MAPFRETFRPRGCKALRPRFVEGRSTKAARGMQPAEGQGNNARPRMTGDRHGVAGRDHREDWRAGAPSAHVGWGTPPPQPVDFRLGRQDLHHLIFRLSQRKIEIQIDYFKCPNEMVTTNSKL